jgi:glycosyltransferase involved in cell wall biosynthesis
MKGKRIFFLAHEISPILGSECSSGWNVSLGLSKVHELTIVYAKNNQFGTENYEEQINNYFKVNGIEPKAKYISVPQPRIAKFISLINKFISGKKSSTGLSVLYFIAYRFWLKKAFKVFEFEHKKNKFEIVHQFNCLSFREPGFLYKSGLPLIWGPVSGLDIMPFSFLKGFPFTMFIKNVIRNSSNNIQFWLSPRIRKTAKIAAKIYAVTKMDYLKLNSLNSSTINLLDVGAIINKNQIERTFDPEQEKLRCIWVGRLDKLKALDILINCLNNFERLKENLEITVVGDGVNKDEYFDLITKYNLTNFKFLGSVNKDSVNDLMNKSHLLIHTSIKEAASAVILEGLSSGLPIVCHDSFGMSHAITKECGFKVEFTSYEKSILGFGNYLETLLKSPELVNKLSIGAYKRAHELSWSGIINTISQDYQNI